MNNKKWFKVMFLLFIGIFTISVASGCSCSCTSSMCSENDIANIKKQIEKNNIEGWRNSATLAGITVESEDYKRYAEAKVDELFAETDCGKSEECSVTDEATKIKADIKASHNNEWLNALEELAPEEEGYIATRTEAFKNYVDEMVESEYSKHAKACLVIHEDIDPATGAKLEAKTWGDAWNQGLLEGLIVYPISWLLSSLTDSFGGNGIAQLLAILIAVIIIRVLMLVLNFRGQLSTIKLQSIQGEISGISEKLKDPNLTQGEKQALSMKMMDIYKKNNINPFSTIISQFISFPIFIAVWAAMNQTLAIRKGTLLGMQLGTAINSQVFAGNIASIVLFVLMIAGQIVSMRLPIWLRKRKQKNNPKEKNKSENSTEKQMNMMMTFMIVLVIASGFVLPAALIVYWLFGSLFSILQTWAFSSEFVTSKLNKLANRKKKAKVVR